MAQIIGPFKRLDARWPNTPCLIPCVVDDLNRIELRFEAKADKPARKGRSEMRIFRTRDGGSTWEEIPTKLASWWQRLEHDRYWPADPIDIMSLSVEGEHLEVVISDVALAYADEGDRQWKVTYIPAKRRWHIQRM